MANVFKDLIPTPVRAYAQQFLDNQKDNQKPLTADFFKPQEMNALVDLIAQSKRTLRSPSINTSDEEWASMIGREPGHVTYEDYHPLEKRPGANFMESVLPLSSDSPLESLRHTLGNFAYEQVVNPQTGEIQYRVTDEYNWDPVYGDYGIADMTGTKRGGGRYPEWKDLLNIIAGRSRPAKIGERSTGKYTPERRLSNIMEWAGGMFGPRSREGEGMRFDVTVPTGEYEELANALAQGEIKPSLKQRLRESADLASREEAREVFKENDFRWMETSKGDDIKTRKDKSKPVVYINYDKWENALPDDRLINGKLPPELVDKYFVAETMHNLEDVDPEMYQKLWDAATGSEAYMDWAANSYKHSTMGRENPTMYGMQGRDIEKRPFDEWLKRSRFDQTLGGYLYAGDPDFPTLRDWSRTEMPGYSESPEFTRLLNELATQLGIQ